jgi:hypothetical protein
MRLNSNREYGGPPDPNAYWRRRCIVLLGALAVLAGLAWLFTGGGPAPAATRSAAVSSSTPPLRSGDALPSAAFGSAWPGDETASATPVAPAPTATAAPAVTAKPNPSQSPNAASPSLAASASAAGGGPRCGPGDIVLSLFTSKSSYGPGGWPQFDVYAVSTGASPCLMAYGAGAVQVIVTWHGRVVWNSASCGSPAAKTVRFQLGVPQVLTVRWNRQAAAPSGCAGSLTPGASGTFDAVALAAGRSSQVRTFKLLR